MRLAEATRLLAAPFRSSAGRAGLLHAGLTLLASLAILGTVYVVTTVYERRSAEEAIATEARNLVLTAAGNGLFALARQIEGHIAADTASRTVYALLDRDRQLIAGNIAPKAPDAGWQSFVIDQGEHAGDNALGLGIPIPGGALLLVARPQGQLDELEETITRAILIAGAIAVLLSILGGVLLGRSVQRRAASMNDALAAVAEGDLAMRLPARADGDEFDALASAVNTTLTRLEGALARLNQVTGDIAHDLRTPLARMRQRLERASRGATGGQVPREVVDRAVADIDEVLRVFAALLRIAQVESGERRASFAVIDLSAALADVVDALAPTAEDAGRPISVAIVPGLLVRGDRELLQQAMVNLIENAFRHTPSNAAVQVVLARDGVEVVASVADQGAGIAAADRDRVMRPFVRLDESRSTAGTGLGLALVRAVADLHGAALILENAEPGLKVSLRLRLLGADLLAEAQH